MKKLSIQQAKYLDDTEILEYLKKYWEIEGTEDLNVWGVLNIGTNFKTDKNFYTLRNVKTKKELPIEYPITDLDTNNTIVNNGIYIQFAIGEKLIKQKEYNNQLFINCKLTLANDLIRKENNNPMLLEVDGESIQILKKVPKTLEILEDNNNLYIESNIYNSIIYDKQKEINLELEELNNRKQASIELIMQEEKEIADKKLKLREEKDRLKDRLSELTTKHEVKIQKLNTEVDEKQKSLHKLDEQKKQIIEDIKNRKTDIITLDEQIKELQKILKNKEDLMGQKLEKLRMYIKEKADTLLDLEFIDQEEYDNLLMINQGVETNEKFVDFENDLQSDKQKAISHIQAYLFEQDIVYPRYILEDFLALIQTNDLIILAGESGSGKTNLIKSFAQAIGGKSFIIPVKPNWTSSEDLLGYYNPLEKKYLTTPFLKALLEAKDNPDIPYFICLDEMNLARVEYYFADFLSRLEERGEQPEIELYSEDESSHILSEFKNVMDVIEHVKEKYKKKNIVNFIQLLQDEEINKELTRIFGFSDKDSLIKYHTDLRRMLSGILNTPSSITFPTNVRIIGAINIDETTHYLSPKILDRAHIMKFDSPLLQDWDQIATEIEEVENKDLKIKFKIEDLGTRENYPKFDREDEFCNLITDMTRRYFSPLGIEVGLRTIRQGLNYKKIFIEQGSNEELVLNNFILHKILPKMTFDGSKSVKENVTKKNVLLNFKVKLEEIILKENIEDKGVYVIDEINDIVKNAESNDEIVNYWA